MSISLEEVTLARRLSSESVSGRFARRMSIERVTDRLASRLASKSFSVAFGRLVGRVRAG
mgnify:CR=1 FL=1